MWNGVARNLVWGTNCVSLPPVSFPPLPYSFFPSLICISSHLSLSLLPSVTPPEKFRNCRCSDQVSFSAFWKH